MKKSLLSLLCLILTAGALAGCAPKEESRTVDVPELGLSYTTPDAWREFEADNIYPLSFYDETTFAEIIYVYLSADAMTAINDGSATIAQVGVPICEIMVAETKTFEEGLQDPLMDYYTVKEEIGTQGDYTYYLLSDFTTAKEGLTGVDLENYTKLTSAMPAFKETIVTREFDPAIITERINLYNQYITFETKTLNDISVNSSLFADFDITIVNFGGTNLFPELNELSDLSLMYKNMLIKRSNPSVNLIYVVTDTPSETAEEIMKKEVAENGYSFTILTMDQYLSAWVKKNLTGVPSTVYVDSTGKIVGDIITGAKGSQVYMDELEKRIEMMEEQK